MKNRILIGALALLACAAVSVSNASASEWYDKAEVSQALDTHVSGIELSDGDVLGAYIGTTAGPVRVEAGVAHVNADLNFYGNSFDASANDYNAAAYLDTASGLYVGAGVNYVQAEAQIGPGYTFEQSGFGWHASGGYAFRAAGGIVEVQATYLSASLDDVDLTQTRATIGYRHAL